MKRPLIDIQGIPDTGEPVFLAAAAPRPKRATARRRSGALAQLLRRLCGPPRRVGHA